MCMAPKSHLSLNLSFNGRANGWEQLPNLISKVYITHGCGVVSKKENGKHARTVFKPKPMEGVRPTHKSYHTTYINHMHAHQGKFIKWTSHLQAAIATGPLGRSELCDIRLLPEFHEDPGYLPHPFTHSQIGPCVHPMSSSQALAETLS